MTGPIQGLRASLNFADASDTTEILTNIGLDIRDLNVIRGISDFGVDRFDIRTLSGLESDLEKEVIAIYNETSSYQNILSPLNDGRKPIDGNIDLAGSIIAPSFKFRTLEFSETFQKTLTSTAFQGSNELEISSISNVVIGQTVSYQTSIPENTKITNITSNVITLSNNITSDINQNELITFTTDDEVRTVDFSTSRASAWSAFGDPTESIFYGSDVILSGANSSIELSSLEFLETPSEKRFESQIPTHKIKIEIDNEEYELYAMKGIPLRFRCFFRSIRDLRIDYNIIDEIRPSWVIRNPSNQQEFVYRNRSSGSGANRQSRISFFDSSSLEREVEFYYPTNQITSIRLNNSRLFEVPNVILPNLSLFEAANCDLTEMPNIKVLYPSIQSLNLSFNDLTRSKTQELIRFTPDVVERLKTPNNTLRTLILNNAYSNECTADLSELTNLTTFIADSSRTSSRRMTGTSPGIGPSVLSYNIRRNNFSVLHPSVMQSQTLRSIDINRNNISGVIDTSDDNLKDLETFISGRNSHPVADMSNKTNLRVYSCLDQNFGGGVQGRTITNIFSGCTNLETINISRTNSLGELPDFSSNVSLRSFNAAFTSIEDANINFSIGRNTFGSDNFGARLTLESFDIRSSALRNPIHPDAFRGMTNLNSLYVTSNGRGITGNYPESLNECFNINTIILRNNQMTGNIPNFSNNLNLRTLDLSSNFFDGDVPFLVLPRAVTILLANNRFTSFQGASAPLLTGLDISENLITSFPSLSQSFRLRNLSISDNPNLVYKSGELQILTSLSRLDMSNCGMAQGDVDRILIDLNENYNNRPRRNVIVNLRGNSAPSVTDEIVSIINRLRREGWTIGVDS
jgi:Leucine-rich repeat (LRR) protein